MSIPAYSNELFLSEISQWVHMQYARNWRMKCSKVLSDNLLNITAKIKVELLMLGFFLTYWFFSNTVVIHFTISICCVLYYFLFSFHFTSLYLNIFANYLRSPTLKIKIFNNNITTYSPLSHSHWEFQSSVLRSLLSCSVLALTQWR